MILIPSSLRSGGHWFVLLLMVLLASKLGAQSPGARPTHAVQSPDGRIEVVVTAGGPLTYRVMVDGKPLLNESRLGLRVRGGVEWGRDTDVAKAERATRDSTWTNRLGKRSQVRDQHQELALTLQEKTGGASGRFQVVFRVFNDGVGFRYGRVDEGAVRDFVLEEELTQFAFTNDSVVYAGDHVAIPPEDYDSRGGFAGSQEWEYRKQRLSDLAVETVTGLPILTQAPAAWVAITEADLLDWAAMWLAREPAAPGSNAVTLRTRLAPRFDGDGLVKGSRLNVSPWRVLMIGREPGRLVESDLVLNLSTPSKIGDDAWVKPGMMAWDRWWPGVGTMDTATMKQFIQFAGEMGWPYQLIDAGWYVGRRTPEVDITKVNPAVDLPELLRFAKERNVRLWLWLYWTDLDEGAGFEKAFAEYEKWGVAGVKIDFMDRDDQEMVNWYERVTAAAAKHKLLVNFHGAYKPTGMIRTYPNQITREGILGNEYNKWSRRVTAEHRVMLPFTRFLAGPGDYTPGGFLNRTLEQFQTRVNPTQVLGTRASQLALFVAYDSPVMCVSDHPDNLRDKPGIDFLKIVPTAWDETRVISGLPGEHIVMARRSGKDWFVGGLNNDHWRVKSFKLDFLGAGNWTMRRWVDAKDSNANPENIDIDGRAVTAAETLDLRMAPGGGGVLHFTPGS